MATLTRGLLLSTAIGSLAGCGPSEVDMAGAEAALLAAVEEYHATSHRSEWVRLTESEAQDILILPANGAPIRGIEAARAFFEATTGLEIRYQEPVVEVSRSGDMGYSLADATLRSITPDGSTMEDEIRDFHLWKRQDGEWKIAIDMWNSALPTVATDLSDRHAALEMFFSDLAAAAQAGDKQAYEGMFAPEATMFLPHRPPVLGRSEVGDWFDSFRTTLELHLESYEQQKFEIVGDVAMVRSQATGYYLNTKSGEKYALDQKYLDVLRYTDGSWQMEYHVANSNTFDPGVWESNWESQ